MRVEVTLQARVLGKVCTSSTTHVYSGLFISVYSGYSVWVLRSPQNVFPCSHFSNPEHLESGHHFVHLGIDKSTLWGVGVRE